jgi:hypothetical protein
MRLYPTPMAFKHMPQCRKINRPIHRASKLRSELTESNTQQRSPKALSEAICDAELLYKEHSPKRMFDRPRILENLLLVIPGLVVVAIMLGALAALAKGHRVLAVFVFIISASIFVTSLSIARTGDLRLRIVALLIAYLGILTAFGAVNYSLYLADPENYVFSNSIETGKVRDLLRTDRHKANELKEKEEMLSLLLQNPAKALEARKHAFVGSDWPSDSITNVVRIDASFAVRFVEFHWHVHGGTGVSHSIEGFYKNDKFIIGGENPFDEDYVPVINVYLSQDESSIKSNLEILRHVVQTRKEEFLLYVKNEESGHPRWTLFDFIYFSGIIMTTVGLGDILPNSSFARLIVLSESVTAVFYVGFGLAFLWPNQK